MKKQYRVKKSKEIEAIIQKHRKSSNPYFTIYIRQQENETNHFRYAMSVGKKIGNAVVRNRIKRQIRAIVRKLDIYPIIDVFIIAREKVKDLNFQEMEKELIFLFLKQKLIRKGENNDSIFK